MFATTWIPQLWPDSSASLQPFWLVSMTQIPCQIFWKKLVCLTFMFFWQTFCDLHKFCFSSNLLFVLQFWSDLLSVWIENSLYELNWDFFPRTALFQSPETAYRITPTQFAEKTIFRCCPSLHVLNELEKFWIGLNLVLPWAAAARFIFTA